MKKLTLIITLTLHCFLNSFGQSKNDISPNKLYDIVSKIVNPKDLLNSDKLLITNSNLIEQVLRQLIYYNLPEYDSTTSNNKTISIFSLSAINKYEDLISQNKAYLIINLGEKTIYSLQFVSSLDDAPTFREIRDDYNLEQMLGKLYITLKNRQYDYSTINAINTEVEKQRVYDIYFDFLNPKFMLGTWIRKEPQMVSRFELTAEGQWGEDVIVNPGWYYPSYILGLNLSRYTTSKTGIVKEFDRPYWSIFVGTAISKSSSIDSNLPINPLRASGNGLMLHLKGKPGEIIGNDPPSFWKNFEIEFKGKFNYSKYSYNQYGIDKSTDIFTNKNYFAFQLNNKHDVQIIDFGYLKWAVGLAFYDLYHYQILPQQNIVKDLDSNKTAKDRYLSSFYAEIGVEKNTVGVFQHDFRFFINYESSIKCGYYGFIFKFLINDTFGFDFRYFRNYTGVGNLPPWKNDEYFFFSPVIRISN